MKQTATASNKPIDLTYGFPGKLPRAHAGDDTAKLLRFFELHAQGVSVLEAALKVGFSRKWGRQYAYRWLKAYPDYVTWLQAHVAQVNVQQLAIEQSDVLNAIARIALANDADYIVFKRKGAKVVAQWKGLHELTREQLAVVTVLKDQKGEPKGYRFRDRDGKLFELAKAVGLLNEKILLEHRHRHLHVHADLSKVPLKRLEALEAEFELLLTHEEPANAQGRLPTVRGHQGKNGGAGETSGGSEDLGGQDHQQSGGSGASQPPKKQAKARGLR